MICEPSSFFQRTKRTLEEPAFSECGGGSTDRLQGPSSCWARWAAHTGWSVGQCRPSPSLASAGLGALSSGPSPAVSTQKRARVSFPSEALGPTRILGPLQPLDGNSCGSHKESGLLPRLPQESGGVAGGGPGPGRCASVSHGPAARSPACPQGRHRQGHRPLRDTGW